MRRHRTKIAFFLCLGAAALATVSANQSSVDMVGAAEVIAADIAADSGKPAANYQGYAMRLAKTLSRLSPEARYRVLKEHTSRVGMGDTTDPGGATNPDGTPGGTTDPDGSTNTPPNDPAVDGPLVDLLNGVPWMPPGDLKATLLEASPLSEAVLAEAIRADNTMAPAGTTEVLLANMPLPTSVYDSIVAGESDLFGSQIQTIVDAQEAAMGGTTAP